MTLTERRKGDRKVMVDLVCQLVSETLGHGHCTVLEMTKRCVWVQIEAPHGLRLTLEFDGESVQPDVYVLPWHLSSTSTAKLNPAVWPNVNTYHFSKSTDVAYGFDDLCTQLSQKLQASVDGNAFTFAARK